MRRRIGTVPDFNAKIGCEAECNILSGWQNSQNFLMKIMYLSQTSGLNYIQVDLYIAKYIAIQRVEQLK